MPIIIPTETVKPTNINPRISIFYGAPKVGKTELLNQNPDPKFGLKEPLKDLLHVDLECGGGYIEGFRVTGKDPITGRPAPMTYADFLDLYNQRADIKKKFKYVAFDTIDKLEEFAERRATENYKASTIGKNFQGYSVLTELERGAGYQWLRTSFHDIFDKCTQMAEHIIFIGHIRDKNLTNSAVGSVSTIAADLDLTGKVRNIACANADAIGYVYRNKLSELCVNFETRDEVNCGTRAKHLKGKKLEPFDWKQIFIEG